MRGRARRTAADQRDATRAKLDKVVVDHPTRTRQPNCRTLKGALGHGERATLVVLRRMLAAQIDTRGMAPAPLAALVKQFREVDADIQAIDVRTAEAAALAVCDDDGAGDDEQAASWDPTKI